MKGKTGKPNAMRGGGIARKGVGMALKGGGIARKGTGSNATPGGKVKKMASGGEPMARRYPPGTTNTNLPGTPTRPAGFPSRPVGTSKPVGSPVPVRPPATPLFGPGGLPGVDKTPKTPGMVRPGFGSVLGMGGPKPVTPGRGGLAEYADSTYGAIGPKIRGVPAHGGKPSPEMIEQYRQNLQSTAKPAKKNGGKVSKYAKGGAVKMTAGAGSGSGRLEKVAAHKSAKRVPATGLKKGGKVKGK